MKRHAMATCLLMAALGVCAQTQEQDSLRVINLQEVEVISTRATNSTPVAFTNIGKEQLKKQNFGQDLPYLLSMTPSAIALALAGADLEHPRRRDLRQILSLALLHGETQAKIYDFIASYERE